MTRLRARDKERGRRGGVAWTYQVRVYKRVRRPAARLHGAKFRKPSAGRQHPGTTPPPRATCLRAARPTPNTGPARARGGATRPGTCVEPGWCTCLTREQHCAAARLRSLATAVRYRRRWRSAYCTRPQRRAHRTRRVAVVPEASRMCFDAALERAQKC